MYFTGCEALEFVFRIELPRVARYHLLDGEVSVSDLDQLILDIKNKVYPKIQLLKFKRRVPKCVCPGNFCNIQLATPT
jgi:hypothetical protein